MWGDACLRIQLHASVNRVCGVDSLGSSEVRDNTRICFYSVNLVNISILQGTHLVRTELPRPQHGDQPQMQGRPQST